MRNLKSTKAITLVALIITIIVLLILAMVSIRLIINGGIIGKSQKATSDYTIAEEKEQIKLGHKEYQMAKFVEENPTLKVEGATVTGDETSIWTITFGKTNNQYTLSKDGIITDLTNSTTTASDFNATEWDQTASSDDWFIWDENDSSIITGFNIAKLSQAEGTVQLRIPSKCREINSSSLMEMTSNLYNELITKIQNNELTEEEAYQQLNNFQMNCISCLAKISQIEIPEGLINIGNSAFEGCISLANITIPNSVTAIGDSAFNNCTSLGSVSIGNSVTSIGVAAFYECTSLSSITIPNSVSSIEGEAFNGCTSLNSITIPNNVTSMGSIVFYGWTSSQTINVRASEIPSTWSSEWNNGCNAQIVPGYTGD